MHDRPSLTSRVYLLRHAQAAWAQPGQKDFDRQLDDAGYAQAQMIADRAADKAYLPDAVLSSTALRCRQTTEAFRRAFNEQFDIEYVDEMYNAEADTYLALIAAQTGSRSVMLVGHNPTIEAVAEALVGRKELETWMPSGFPTAGLAVFDAVTDPADGSEWRISEFLTP